MEDNEKLCLSLAMVQQKQIEILSKKLGDVEEELEFYKPRFVLDTRDNYLSMRPSKNVFYGMLFVSKTLGYSDLAVKVQEQRQQHLVGLYDMRYPTNKILQLHAVGRHRWEFIYSDESTKRIHVTAKTVMEMLDTFEAIFKTVLERSSGYEKAAKNFRVVEHFCQKSRELIQTK